MMLLSYKSSADKCTMSAFNVTSEHLWWGNAGRWPLDSLYFASHPHTPCHGSRMAGPACPACSSPEEGTTCQRKSSQLSTYFPSVCTSSWFTCDDSQSNSIQEVASVLCSYLISFLLQLFLLFPQVSENYLFPLWWVKTARLYRLSSLLINSYFLPSTLDICHFCGHSLTIFCLSLHLPAVLLFSLPTFLSCASPRSRARRAASAYRATSQPASESQPAHGRPNCAWGCGWGQPLSPSLISTSTVPVCWHPAIHTHSSPSFARRF